MILVDDPCRIIHSDRSPEDQAMNRYTSKAAVIFLSSMLIASCTTTGSGTGATRRGTDHVSFTWVNHGSTKGEISATLNESQQVFSGTYFQITSETRVDELRPLWVGWNRRRGEWGYWGAYDRTGFVTHYSGHVVANMESNDGQHIRCDFRLMRPFNGMAGGGMGRCQMPDGKTIDATFPGK
jgi:hypothetical protein